jgi:hypothetical protein
VSPLKSLQNWWQEKTGEEETPFDGDSSAFFASLLFHMLLLIVLGLVPFVFNNPHVSLTIAAPLQEEFEDVDLMVPKEFTSSPLISQDSYANSVGDVGMSMSLAQIVSDVSVVPSPTDVPVEPSGEIALNNEISLATGLNFNVNLTVKGATGEGVAGAVGAVDRLTQEILRSLEERKTLVVWLFDQSPSLSRERAAISERFDRIYDELGVIEASGNPAFAKHEDKPLLTSVMSFGQEVKLLTKQPTDDLQEIKAAVAGITEDESGVEKIFSAVYLAAERFKGFRIRDPATNQPERNVLLVAFTDERGDDLDGLDQTVSMCRRYAMPVYVVGVPAPFGQEETYVKWIDPDPNYDQSPQWGRVNQGPETLFPERIKLGFGRMGDRGPDPMDSGFGPFALTRMCYETGGIYFSVHPSRNVQREVSRDETPALTAHLKYFFDPQVMRRYRPDYVPAAEYLRRAESNRARAALLMASQKSWVQTLDEPVLRFVRRGEPELANALAAAQKVAAQAEPALLELYNILKEGEADRARETTLRWQAGYDLAMGRVLASLVRVQAYRARLAEASRGMPFQDAKNNTWVLAPCGDLAVDGPLAGMAAKAKEYLQEVITCHPGTPWELLAKRELELPLGWNWAEEYTDLTPRRDGSGGNGGNGGRPRDDVRNVERKPPKREPPRL